ncbi:hypothetical protein MWU58_10005 [Flavobacteriaceae bacterium S0825]|uniref:hypothetical protein n=1 Tax=Gaetbulibacter sp. S0825 TaxID=2720084 RepID=UPI00142FB39C|nr:hypothetical protein [Gaetbulibacter sp. S0825]MCK0109627.1 hypothetical protein [Flavobacteriaceae bacterium S0825]NIX65260.1 hypothetical protein [Gaetbulibacter sp. S0825]
MKLSTKYPGEYFNHWIAMFATNNSELNEAIIKDHIEMYKSFEGEEEFTELKLEIKDIIDNGDLHKFVKVAKNYGLKKVRNKDLMVMVELITSQ